MKSWHVKSIIHSLLMLVMLIFPLYAEATNHSPQELLEDGMKLMEKDYARAVKAFEKVINFDPPPDNEIIANAWYRKAYALGELGKYSKAVKAYTQTINWFSITKKTNVEKIKTRNYKAWALENLNRYEEAIKYYDKALKLEERNDIDDIDEVTEIIYALRNRGWDLGKLGRYIEAIESLDNAIERLDNTTIEHIDNARKDKIKKEYTKAFNSKAWILLWQGKYEDAIEYFSKAEKTAKEVKESFSFKWFWYGKAVALHRHGGNLREDIDSILEMGKPEDGNASEFNNYGIILIDLNRYEDALRKFKNALTFLNKSDGNPNKLAPAKHNELFAKISSNIAVVKVKLNNDEVVLKQAIRDTKEALNYTSNNAVYLNNLGDFYLELENYDEAIKNYNKAIKFKKKEGDSGSWRSHMGLAKAFINLGDKRDEDWMYSKALVELETVKMLFPDIELDEKNRNDYYYQQGYTHAKLDKWADAKNYFKLCKDDQKANRNFIRIKQRLKANRPTTVKRIGGLIITVISSCLLICIFFFYLIRWKRGLVSEKMVLVLVPILLGFIAVGIYLPDIKSFTGPGGIGFESETTITPEIVNNLEQ